jgi:hypothetical protein
VTPASTPPGTPPVTPTRTPSPSATPASTPPNTPAVTPTRTPSETPPAQGFAITLYGRGNSIGSACGAAGEKTVYVALEQTQTFYNNFGFGFIEGKTLYENIFLTSTVADPYAADNNLNVYAINSGVVGAFTFGC